MNQLQLVTKDFKGQKRRPWAICGEFGSGHFMVVRIWMDRLALVVAIFIDDVE